MTRRINGAGLGLVKSFEGLRLTAYRDAVGVWTIGYGHTGKDVTAGMKITEAQAEALLQADLQRFEAAVEKYITVPLNDNQFAALVSFTYNLGERSLAGSTLRKKLNAGDYAAVPAGLAKWVNAGGKKLAGLVRRRKAEADLWNTPFVASPAPQEPAKEAQEPVPAPTEPEAPSIAPAAKQAGIAAAVVGIIAATAHWWHEIGTWIAHLF